MLELIAIFSSVINTKHLLCVPSCQEVQEFRGNHEHPVEDRAKMKLLTEVDTNMLGLKKKKSLLTPLPVLQVLLYLQVFQVCRCYP